MALTKCTECGNNVSTLASACPKCGAPPSKEEESSTEATSSVDPNQFPQTALFINNKTKKTFYFSFRKILTILFGFIIIVAVINQGKTIAPILSTETKFIAKFWDNKKQHTLTETRIMAWLGVSNAQYELGVWYANGDESKGVERDSKKAIEWYSKAAEQGDTQSLYNLANMYRSGDGVPQNYKNVFELYSKVAEQGYSQAQYKLGEMYAKGEGVQQDYKKAIEWYTKASSQDDNAIGDPRTGDEIQSAKSAIEYQFGKMYANGEGVQQNYKKAIEWYTKASEHFNADAQHQLDLLAACHKTGMTLDALMQCANQGDAYAQFNLGVIYETGESAVPQDYKKAFEWYTKAAEQGYEEAQNNLGVMYDQGKGIPQNTKSAFEWFTKAAEQGFVLAQKNLDNLKQKKQKEDDANTFLSQNGYPGIINYFSPGGGCDSIKGTIIKVAGSNQLANIKLLMIDEMLKSAKSMRCF